MKVFEVHGHFYEDNTFNRTLVANAKAEERAKVIDELQDKIDYEYYDGGYGTYHEVEMIVRMIQELKEQK